MVIIHDHACSTTVKLYGIYDSTKMCRFSSTTTRGDRLCDPSRAEQRGGADAAVRVRGHLEAFLLDARLRPCHDATADMADEGGERRTSRMIVPCSRPPLMR